LPQQRTPGMIMRNATFDSAGRQLSEILRTTKPGGRELPAMVMVSRTELAMALGPQPSPDQVKAIGGDQGGALAVTR
jgi:hypothetical protein